MNQSLTVEVVLFKLKPGVEEAAFVRASDALLPVLRAMSGFVRRELLKGEDGQWIDLVHWNSLAEAQAAAEQVPHLPACHPFLGMIDETSVTMLHLQQASAGQS